MLPVPSSSPGRRRSPRDAPLATKIQGDTSILLPRDVISEILSRLPVKSLCRFRCASRRWCKLISNPVFVSKHRHRTEPLIVASALRESSLRLFDMEGNVVKVIRGVGSFTKSISNRADELVCLMHGLDGAKVMDLATGEVLATYSGGRPLGFGRAVPSGLYKLVCFTCYKCEILTLGDHVGWRKKGPISSIVACYSDTITIDGVVYLFLQDQVNIIVRFDLESEEWQKQIRGPPLVPEKRYKISLSELGGSLCVGTTETDPRGTCGGWDIWLRKDTINSIWVKAYSISSCAHYALTPLKVLPDGKKLFFYGFPGRGPQLLIYDPDDGTCTEVAIMPDDNTCTISLCTLHLERFVSRSGGVS